MERKQLFREKSKLASQVHITVGAEQFRDYSWKTFRAFGAFREALLLDRVKDGKLQPDIESSMARGFADRVFANLQKGIEVVGCEAIVLMPSVINGLPGGGANVSFSITIPGEESAGPEKSVADTVMPINSIAIGLIREDGLATPVAFSTGLMLLQHGGGHMCNGYDHRTDFAGDFKTWLRPASYI